MASIPLLIEDELERLSAPTQIDSFGGSSVNRAFITVAQEVVGLLKQSHPFQTDSINRTEMIMIRASDPEYRQVMEIEPLTARELEVLQLIVEGHNNPTIAGRLHITMGTVKTHVRNILKKLYVSDRTQAAIRALRSGLVR
ncbi:response regulator transcription factor [Phormidium sp. CLA17]|uniref:response regulator transcription factor n=1 Tax=Leptolyngbya sp. Cla-17 TaxID=2803751 RepID=UPI00149179F8|nr:response regulator transcription factor [Leptolyngbya sp. Cla-17]MBM0744434.1 response regulator transcription factor [Leptolyngbya sp. Cla-17]